MTNKSFAFILSVLIGAGVAGAQTPEPKADNEGVAKTFSFAFNSDGGYLGVQTEDVSKENLAKYALREVRGVGVDSVVDGSPAQAAGLQKGDVIVRLNGDEITSARKLTRLVGEIAPDHQARLTVIRGGSEREITVTVGKRPGPKWDQGSFQVPVPLDRLATPAVPELMPNLQNLPRIERAPLPPVPGRPGVWTYSNRRQIGVGVTPLTKQLAGHFGVDGGVLVNNVRENSAAAKAGIKAGDIITEVDGKAVNGDLDLIRAISEKKDGSITLTVMRDRSRQTISVTPEEVKGGADTFFQFSAPDAPDAPDAPSVFKMAVPTAPSAPILSVPFGFPSPVI